MLYGKILRRAGESETEMSVEHGREELISRYGAEHGGQLEAGQGGAEGLRGEGESAEGRLQGGAGQRGHEVAAHGGRTDDKANTTSRWVTRRMHRRGSSSAKNVSPACR